MDGLDIERAARVIRQTWPDIRQALLAGKYRPSPVRKVMIPKPDGSQRELGIPTVTDRLIQQALLQVLQPLIDRLKRRIDDAGVIWLVRAYLNAGIMDGGVVLERHLGTPQGGSLSPLLANAAPSGASSWAMRCGRARAGRSNARWPTSRWTTSRLEYVNSQAAWAAAAWRKSWRNCGSTCWVGSLTLDWRKHHA